MRAKATARVRAYTYMRCIWSPDEVKPHQPPPTTREHRVGGKVRVKVKVRVRVRVISDR